MRSTVVLMSIVAISACFLINPPMSAAGEDQQASITTAKKASLAWLALVDEGKIGESWENAAELFKKAVTKEQWKTSLNSVISTLGKAEERELDSAAYTKSLPGAPDGEYVVIQYKTRFDKRKAAVETVTPMLDPDGAWRVSGYYIR